MIKRKYTFPVIVFLMIAATAAIIPYKTKDELLPVSLKALQLNSGWGYEIVVDGKTFIRQTAIPAVDGNIGFSTKKQALLVGNHAMAKLKNGKLPQITVAELRDWGVIKEISTH
jgi:hypothetical protein